METSGIRDPEVAVPLATTTGWNFRDPSIGNPVEIYQLLGSYIPFAPTRAARQANGDPRLSLEERYRGVDDYLRRIRTAAMDLIGRRFLLAEDLDVILERAKQHWSFVTRGEDFRLWRSSMTRSFHAARKAAQGRLGGITVGQSADEKFRWIGNEMEASSFIASPIPTMGLRRPPTARCKESQFDRGPSAQLTQRSGWCAPQLPVVAHF